MTTIKVQNCYSFVLTDDEEIRLKLWKALRHRERGYFHTTLYKRKLWDGFTNFFSKETGKFLTGLLPEVEAAFKFWKKEYTIQDERTHFEFAYKSVDQNFLNKWLPKDEKPITLYDYQVDLINQLIKYKRGIIQAPTGSGKSLLFLGILCALPENTPTLILTSTKGLLNQIYLDMQHLGFKNVGRLYDKFKEPNITTLCTLASLGKLTKLLPKIKVLVVDEVHLALTKRVKKYYNQLENATIRVAISATPFKFGGKDKTQKYSVKGYFGPVLKTFTAGDVGILSTAKLQERQILSPAKCYFLPIDEPKIPYATYGDAVSLGIAQNLYLHQIVVKLVKSLKGRTLILVERLSHGDTLNSLLQGSLWIQGKDDLESRQYVVEKLQQSKNTVVGIATSGIFGTGINIKAHSLINCSGGMAQHQTIQRLGRGLRTADDKDQLNYFDFNFLINDYLHNHSKKRIKVLKEEGHEIFTFNTLDEFWEEWHKN